MERMIDLRDGEEPHEEPSLGAPSLAAALEALLLLAEDPMSVEELARATFSEPDEVARTLADLAAQYDEQGRGFELRQLAGAWRFYTSHHCSALIQRWVTDARQSKLSQAALETLAVIAYRQPVARAVISSIRGVNVDGVVRTLLARGLIEERGSDPTTGARLYATTDYFLERMGMTSLTDLPAITHLLPDPSEVTHHTDGEPLE